LSVVYIVKAAGAYHLRRLRLDDELRVLRVGLNPSLPQWHPRLCASKAKVLLLVMLDESLSPGDEVDLESVADKPFLKFVGQLEIFSDGRHISPFSLIVRCLYCSRLALTRVVFFRVVDLKVLLYCKRLADQSFSREINLR